MNRLEEVNVRNQNRLPPRRSVSFGNVSIREFEQVVLDNPDSVLAALKGSNRDACLTGYKYKPNKTVTLEEWERTKEERRKQLAALRASSKSKKHSSRKTNPPRRINSDIVIPHRSMFTQKSTRQSPPRRASSDITNPQRSTRRSAKQMSSTDDSGMKPSKALILEEWEQMKEKRRIQAAAMRATSKSKKPSSTRKKNPPTRSSSDIIVGTRKITKQTPSTTDDSQMKRRIQLAIQKQTEKDTVSLIKMQQAVQRHINAKRVAAANSAS